MMSAGGERRKGEGFSLYIVDVALWSRITKNPDVSTGPLARPFVCLLVISFARTAYWFACSTHFARSLLRSWDSE